MTKIVTVLPSDSTKYIRAGIFFEHHHAYTLVDEELKHYSIVFAISYTIDSYSIMSKMNERGGYDTYTAQDIENHICFVGTL